MNRALLAVILSLVTAPVAAQQWQPGAGCEPFLTVQSRGCMVSNYWTCDGAPDGYVYFAMHDLDGPVHASVLDAEGVWVDSMYPETRERTLYPMADPISVTDLMETGMDSYDFTVISNTPDPSRPITQTRVRGVDVLTGVETEIDGEGLIETAMSLSLSGKDGIVWATVRGTQYFSPDLKLVFAGRQDWIENGTATAFDNSPVAFLRPGEPGFGTMQPENDCDAPPTVKEDTGGKAKSVTE